MEDSTIATESMDLFENLSEQERVLVANVITQEWGHPQPRITLASLLFHWRRRVATLVETYAMSLDDFTLALSERDTLEEVRLAGGFPLRERLGKALEAADAQFRSRSVEVARPLMGTAPQRWWWYRVPVLRGADINRQLAVRNLLPPVSDGVRS